MSSKMEDPPEGLSLVDDDTKLKRLDEWSKNVVSLARVMCNEPDGLDERGHNKKPCKDCLKGVRHVTEYWFMAMHIKAKALLKKSEDEGVDLPYVDLHEAYYIASSLLDPAVSVQIEGWGPA